MRNVDAHELIPSPRKHLPGLRLHRAMFRTTLQNETSPELKLTRCVFSFPNLLVAHYGGRFLICPTWTQDQILVEPILPPDAPLLLYPTPCATVTSLNNTQVLLAGEGSFGDPVRDLTDIGDGDGNLVARAQVLGRGSGVTDPFGCARQ